MTQVSLDPFRSPGVSVFAGRDRGQLVGHYMQRMYGFEIEILIPSDIRHISNSFFVGLGSILPGPATKLRKDYDLMIASQQPH